MPQERKAGIVAWFHGGAGDGITRSSRARLRGVPLEDSSNAVPAGSQRGSGKALEKVANGTTTATP